jgi:hypothetical protein|eukprot:COSAG02_NODE_1339_length_13187_cov_610.871027_10_plen_195_part_00
MSGITVRPLRPDDVAAATALFVGGMTETLDGGARRSMAARCAIAGAAAAVAVAAAADRVLKLQPSRTVALALLPIGASVAVCMYAPRKIASDYVNSCLATDMADPVKHYRAAGARNCFWVAVDDSTREVIGTVAVEDISAPQSHGKEDGWSDGDAELRRMSVSPMARGCVVSHPTATSRDVATRRSDLRCMFPR